MSPLALLLACAAGAQEEAVGANGAPSESVFVAVEAAKSEVWLHEPLEVTITFGVETAFLDERLVPLFRRPLDVPVQLVAPWLADAPSGAAAGPRFVLGDGPVPASGTEDRAIEGRPHRVWWISRTLRFDTPGPIALEPTRLHFAYATRFEDHFVHGRVPLDRNESSVRAAPLTIEVRALPSDARPAGFAGSVGRFAVRAETDTISPVVGQSFALTLHVRDVDGGGRFEAPSFAASDDFHPLGRLEEPTPDGWRLRYDLTPLRAGETSLPIPELVAFDPATGRYETLRTAAIPLRVGADPDGPAEAPAGDSAATAADAPGADAPAGISPLLIAGFAVVAFAVVAVAARRGRVRTSRASHESDAADAQRAAAVAASLEGARARATTAPEEALVEFLASGLACAPGAVVTPDLAARLAASGAPTALAEETRDRLDALVAARYAGANTPSTPNADTGADVVDLLTRLAHEWPPATDGTAES